jgi:signal peptidase II
MTLTTSRLATLLLTVVPALAAAEDRVVRQQEGKVGRIVITGTVDDYTGVELRIRRSLNNTVAIIPADEVLDVRTDQCEPHSAGQKFLKEGRISEALEQLELALGRERRHWVRREILALLVRCELRRGGYAAAARHFLPLVESDPATRHFGLIPLAWANPSFHPNAKAEARGWLKDRSDVAQLIGASWLVADPADREPSLIVLKSLSTNADRRIRELAQAQVWRTQVGTNAVTVAILDNWQRRVEALPESLRAGPAFVVGRGFVALQEFDRAAVCLLWLPITDNHDTHLTSRSLLDAAAALERIGQTDQAASLYREATVRYAGTPAAAEAADLLRESQAP